ncbi:1758_t:CDS:2 [Funneliformis geosporum]|uniref:1758_t:CDS:1 n=1 Tax=Funneliformis geosporum TaxID=1117311 RepID=A0A9W4SYP3_9GLOM|nr:1758_t:CDS:2 [Funneliformis geosporum]
MDLLQEIDDKHCKILFGEPIGYKYWLINHGVEDINARAIE